MVTGTTRANWGCVGDDDDERAQRERALADPGAYHGAIAAAELHWHDDEHGRWLRREPADGPWRGYDARDGAIVEAAPRDGGWTPWRRAFDDTNAPFYRWFVGARTNACFNEVDRHVLAGRGAHAAFVFEGDRWDPSRNGGTGGSSGSACSGRRCSPAWACAAATASPSTCRTSPNSSTTRRRRSASA